MYKSPIPRYRVYRYTNALALVLLTREAKRYCQHNSIKVLACAALISLRDAITIRARTIEIVVGLSRPGPARQDLRTVSGPDGSSTKESFLGVADQPGLGKPMTVSFLLASCEQAP